MLAASRRNRNSRGVCRSTVWNAFREARTLNLITLQERRPPCAPFLTDLIRIMSSEWKLWLRNMEDTELPFRINRTIRGAGGMHHRGSKSAGDFAKITAR
jgi:hypothetical protein